MTSRIDGQTDEQAEGDAIGSGKSGLERVQGSRNADLAPNSRTTDGVRDTNAWILPEGRVTLVPEEPGGVAGRRSYGKCQI